MKRILVVEDDMSLVPILQPMIRKIQPDSRIDWFTSAEDAFECLKRNRRTYDVVLSDIGLAGRKSGLDLVEDCYQHRISANFVLTSGSDSISTRFPFLPKPLRLAEVEETLGPFLGIRKQPPRANPRLDENSLEQIANQELAIGWFFVVLMTGLYIWAKASVTS